MELYHATKQWAERPADEKFNSLDVMYATTKSYADAAATKTVPWTDLRVEGVDEDLTLIGKAGVAAKLTNYAFKQLAARVKAPAPYLQTLPARISAQLLNYGLGNKTDGTAQLLFHQNGGLVLRAATSEQYERVWNHEVIARLIDLSQRQDLEPARQTFNWSDEEMTQAQIDAAPRSLYASDHDMFAFLMSRSKDVTDPTGQTLRRGIIVTNSEVGDCSLGVMGFYFREVCANHIIWGASNLATIRIAHRGEIRGKFADAQVAVRRYLDSDTSFEKAAFAEMTTRIGTTKEEVLDTLFGKKSLGLTRKALESSYDAVVPEQDGDPRTKWGIVQGITRFSQTSPYADERTDLDRAAGKLLEIEF